MYLIIDTLQPVDLRTVKAERTTTGAIWLRHPRGDYSLWMDDGAARELVAQLTAILEPTKASPETLVIDLETNASRVEAWTTECGVPPIPEVMP